MNLHSSVEFESSEIENRLTAVLISADIEWRAVCGLFPEARRLEYPYGEYFPLPTERLAAPRQSFPALLFHGGWGKISAAASTQYIIDRWQPRLIINLGTCGGIEGRVERGTIILVNQTIVYDIIEQMGDYDEHLAHYSTNLDLSWLGNDFPQAVLPGLMLSADRDILSKDIPWLVERFNAVAADWESGAIAYVAARNQKRLLILRGVTDLVSQHQGEAYGNLAFFENATADVMRRLISALPAWIERGLR